MRKIVLLVLLAAAGACSGEKAAQDLTVGDCFDEPETETITEVELIDCADPHTNEVFEVYDLEGDDFGEDAEFPGENDISDQAASDCEDAFEDYVGAPFLETELTILPIVPTEKSWEEDDDREVACTLSGQEPLEGSMKDSGPSESTETSTEAPTETSTETSTEVSTDVSEG